MKEKGSVFQENIVSITQAGSLVSMTRQRVDVVTKKGEIPTVEIVGREFVDKVDLIAWCESKGRDHTIQVVTKGTVLKPDEWCTQVDIRERRIFSDSDTIPNGAVRNIITEIRKERKSTLTVWRVGNRVLYKKAELRAFVLGYVKPKNPKIEKRANKVLALWEKGISRVEIARELKILPIIVTQDLKRRGVGNVLKKPTKAEVEARDPNIMKMAKSGSSIGEIANHFEMGVHNVRRIICKYQPDFFSKKSNTVQKTKNREV